MPTNKPTLSPTTTTSDPSLMIIGLGIAIPAMLLTIAGVFFFKYRSKRNQTEHPLIPYKSGPSNPSPTPPPTSKKYLGFLTHSKAETGIIVSFIKVESDVQMKKRYIKKLGIFLDSEHLKDLRELSDRVQESKVMAYVLTKSYLTRPWCLIELHYALEFNIPIISVNIVDAGYDFKAAEKYLENLDEDKLEQVNPGASKELKELNIDINQLGKRLSEILPKIIAHKYDPKEESRERNAQLEGIFDDIINVANRKR